MFKQINSKISSKDSGSEKSMRVKFGLPFVLGMSLLITGCANRVHHVEVGAIPDDYQTRHPIVVTEQDQTLDLPVGQYSNRLTNQVGDTIHGFAQNYLKSSASYMTIMKPVGSGNSDAAKSYSRKILQVLNKYGVPKTQVTISPYDAQNYGDNAPIRLIYTSVAALTGECGKWEEDVLANDHNNKNYKNFGCATQNNLARQVANPLDLLYPRAMSPVDAARRATAIGTYQTSGAGL